MENEEFAITATYFKLIPCCGTIYPRPTFATLTLTIEDIVNLLDFYFELSSSEADCDGMKSCWSARGSKIDIKKLQKSIADTILQTVEETLLLDNKEKGNLLLDNLEKVFQLNGSLLCGLGNLQSDIPYRYGCFLSRLKDAIKSCIRLLCSRYICLL